MPVAVNQPRQVQEKDPLDTILKGLSIAHSIYGIKEAGDKMDLLKEQRANEAEAKKIAAFQSGVVQGEDGSYGYTPEKQQERDMAQVVNQATLLKTGFQMGKDENGKPIPVSIPGFKDTETELKKGQIKHTDAQTRKIEQELLNNAGGKRKDSDEITTKLRQERDSLPVTKNTQSVAVAYNKMSKAAEQPSAANDISLIYGFMRINDPSSTVREGEFATAQNAAGVPTKIINLYNKTLEGTRLAPEQRDDFLNSAGQIYNAQIEQQNKADGFYKKIAADRGLNVDHVITPFGFDRPERIMKVRTESNPGLSDKFSSLFGTSKANASVKQTPQTVIQNGHTYTLNPKTGKYE